MANGIEISDALFPIILQTMYAEIRDTDVEAMIAWYERHFAKNLGRHAVVVYGTPDHGTMNAKQRKRVGAWQKSIEERTRELCVSSAIVLHSAFQRGALTALNWIYPPPVPQKAFASLPDAFDWALAALRAEQITIPPHVLRYREDLVNESA